MLLPCCMLGSVVQTPINQGGFSPWGAAASTVSLRTAWHRGLGSLSAADCTHLSHFHVLALHIFWNLPVLKASSVHISPTPGLGRRQAQQMLAELKRAFFLSSEQILLEYLRKHNNTLVVSWGNGPTFAGKRHGAGLAGLPRTPNT